MCTEDENFHKPLEMDQDSENEFCKNVDAVPEEVTEVPFRAWLDRLAMGPYTRAEEMEAERCYPDEECARDAINDLRSTPEPDM